MPNLTTDLLDNALSGFRVAMEADGYSMSTELDEDGVTVHIIASENACAECLVPKAVMENIVLDSIRSAEPSFSGKLRIEYPPDNQV